MTKYYLPFVIKVVGLVCIFLWVLTLMLYPLRNSKQEAVADRFIRNNDVIEREVGEIKEIVKPDTDISSRSREIARQLNGGDGKNSQLQTSKVIGTKKTIEYKVTLDEVEYFNRGVYYFVVKEAFWRNEGEEWQKFTPGYFENYFLLFK